MKTLHRLFIATTEIDREPRERAAEFLSIDGVLTIKNSYRVDPHVLDHLTLESDDDIDERSLRAYVAEPGFHNIHLILTADEWEQLGLRPTLYGQSRVVDSQIITYARPYDKSYNPLRRYSQEIQEAFTKETILEWHEPDHGLRWIFGIRKPTTHAAFYGYAAADSDKHAARRWVRKPYPFDAWMALPWYSLVELQPKRPIYMTIIEKLTKAVELLTRQRKGPSYQEPFPQWDIPTQTYGVANPSLYPITGHHIGTDFPTPAGTPILAPERCEVTRVGSKPESLGHWCEVKLDDVYLIFAHLKARPYIGLRERGWVIAFTGDTGQTYGEHCHVEGWREPMNRRKLGKNTWQELTFDVTKFI